MKIEHQYSVAPDFQFHSPLPLPKNHNLIPTNNEINDSLVEIQSQFPDLLVDKVVNMLYNNLIAPKVPSQKAFSENGSVRSRRSKAENRSIYKQSCQTSKQYPQQGSEFSASGFKIAQKAKNQAKKQTKKQKKHPKGQHEQNLRKAQEWDTQTNKEYHFNQAGADQTASKNPNLEVSMEDQKLVAKSFCDNGYGLNKLKQHVWDQSEVVLPMNYQTYVRVLKVVISESYRKLEQFLIQECGKNIKPLATVQVRALFAILSNVQTKFEEEESFTFRKFMKITYDIESVSIFEQSAVKLFIKIQVSLRGRIGVRLKMHRSAASEFKHRKDMLRSPGRYQNQRFETQTIWTAELEADLVETIAEQRTIAKTRDVMQVKYGDNVVLGNVKELKARFFKILRTSIKRLMKYAKEYAHKVPLLVDIIDQRIKILMRSPDAVDARIALGRLYKTKSPSAEMLTEVITLVNQFYFLDETRREHKVSRREPAISCVTDKIKHNISVSRRMLRNVTTPAQRAGENAQLVFLKKQQASYQHIVSLEHEDKLHYFRKTGIANNKGGFEYQEKSPFLKKLELDDGDDDSNMPVLLSDEDDEGESEAN